MRFLSDLITKFNSIIIFTLLNITKIEMKLATTYNRVVMVGKYWKWVIGLVLVVLSCQTPINETLKFIDAQTCFSSGTFLSIVTGVKLTTSYGTPIRNANVVFYPTRALFGDTLTEVEPGFYSDTIIILDPFPLFDTLKLYVNDRGDTLHAVVPIPQPVFVSIITPSDQDTIYVGEQLFVAWHPNDPITYYEVKVIDSLNNDLVFEKKLKDTTTIIPQTAFDTPGEYLLKVAAVNGPQLVNGDLISNVEFDNWEGGYAVKIVSRRVLYVVGTY